MLYAHPRTPGAKIDFRPVYDNFINGRFVPPVKGQYFDVITPITGKTFPVAWITQHPKARILCLTLGHDGKAHEHPAYQQILRNSLQWVSRK